MEHIPWFKHHNTYSLQNKYSCCINIERRKDAQGSPEVEVPQRDLFSCIEFLQQKRGDEKARDEKKHAYPKVTRVTH